MLRSTLSFLLACSATLTAAPLGEPGTVAVYRAATTIRAGVTTFTITLGPESANNLQWVRLQAQKRDGASFQIWLLRDNKSTISRYLFQPANSPIREYTHALTQQPVLPSLLPWDQLWPRHAASNEILPQQCDYLGHAYTRLSLDRQSTITIPTEIQPVPLRPDLWLGPPSNTRQKDETRRYDTSDYELIRLTESDYKLMAGAGITVVKADAEQQPWAEALGLYFWGPHTKLAYPELLYNSQYLGPTLFLDEPAVGTRDHDLRPRLEKDPAYRKSITPQEAFKVYQQHYAKSITAGPPQVLKRTLAARTDVDLGTMDIVQQNLYNWETMPSTAAWALSQDPHVPSAMVFEPPGRIGTRRTVPEFNMTYGTHFRVDDMRVLPAIVFGFLRGAASLNGKQWGVSIYGAVERADTFWWLTHAYDLGATRFFFWDNYQLACVPFNEVLTLSRHLRAHAKQHPQRDLQRLSRAAHRAILLPPGYDLGHVQMGRGNLWGITELNLERINRRGVKYRAVMSRFFAEIERSLQQSVAFDLFWDLPGLKLDAYKEVIRINEDATVQNTAGAPAQPPGAPPQLEVTISGSTATARVTETTDPIYYTLGADPTGVLHNAMVLWELYGPAEEDYLFLQAPNNQPTVRHFATHHEVEINFPATRPGKYRLRAATVDLSGRSTVVWKQFTFPK